MNDQIHTERLALLYSDDSFGVLAKDATIEKAREVVKFCDQNETRKEHLTKIAKVRIDIIEIIEGTP